MKPEGWTELRRRQGGMFGEGAIKGDVNRQETDNDRGELKEEIE